MNEVIVRSKRDLYNLNMIILDYQIDNKFIDNPLIIFCNKIQNCLEKDGLEFIDSIRIIIYQIHLLNYNRYQNNTNQHHSQLQFVLYF